MNHEPITNNHKKGFTLIELLVVITIIGILVAAGIYSWQGAQLKARDDRRKSDLRAIQAALENYYQVNGKYPPGNVPEWNQEWGWCTRISSSDYPELKNALEPTYISKVPTDPVYGNTVNDYVYNNPGPPFQTYQLATVLENPKDPDYDQTGYNYSACDLPGSMLYRMYITQP